MVDLSPQGYQNFITEFSGLMDKMNLKIDEVYESFHNFKVLIMDYFINNTLSSGTASLALLVKLQDDIQNVDRFYLDALKEHKLEFLDKLIVEIMNNSKKIT